MKKKVYLSGRMSGLPESEWRLRFMQRKWLLEWSNAEVRVVDPSDTIISRHPWLYRIVGYRLTLWYDLQLLRRCTHFTMVGGDWNLSRGARLERLKALRWGITEI